MKAFGKVMTVISVIATLLALFVVACPTLLGYGVDTLFWDLWGKVARGDHIQVSEKALRDSTGTIAFSDIPVAIANHNVTSELKDFVSALEAGVPCATDVYQGTRTVAFAEAAIRSAQSGRPEAVDYDY